MEGANFGSHNDIWHSTPLEVHSALFGNGAERCTRPGPSAYGAVLAEFVSLLGRIGR